LAQAHWPVQVDDKHWVSVPTERIKGVLSILIELYDGALHDGKLRISMYNAGVAAELEALFEDARITGHQRIQHIATQLSAIHRLPKAQLAASFQAQLRDYQDEGVAWLQYLRNLGLGGLLADDMGLGKTVQALAYLLQEKVSGRAQGPNLIIAPTSVILNWQREASHFAPDLSVLLIHGPNRHAGFTQMAQYDLVLTTYPLLVRDQAHLKKQLFDHIVCDEAQFIKNPKAKVSQVVRGLQARQRLALTGTPIENHLGELWSIYDFLLPGLLGNQRWFSRVYRFPIEKNRDQARQQALAQRISPFLLRRTKEAVALELPEKTEIIQTIELEGAQRDLYEAVRIAMHEKMKIAIADQGFSRSQIIILDALLKLRQTCCHPQLLSLSQAKSIQESAKMTWLMQNLPEMIEDGRRIILFSQFAKMLSLIEKALKHAHIEYIKLTGQTRDRQTLIDTFQACKVPVFLISLKAGGTGLNLTAADTVIHFDPWWNPAAEDQATDRAYRIGQDKPVFVYKLIAAGTVEESILALQKKKKNLVQGLIGNQENQQFQLNDDTIRVLFAPIQS